MTDANKVRNYPEPLSLRELQDSCKECGIDEIPTVTNEPRLWD